MARDRRQSDRTGRWNPARAVLQRRGPDRHSDDWGASKPDPEFFKRVAAAVPFGADEILYVGDRCDNDIKPAGQASMYTALVHRGPWATIQWKSTEAKNLPTLRIDGLLELPPALRRLNGVEA